MLQNDETRGSARILYWSQKSLKTVKEYIKHGETLDRVHTALCYKYGGISQHVLRKKCT